MAEKIKTVDDGSRLTKTQTGEERERFSRLYGVFMETDPTTNEKVLVLRNFASQRIMNDWMKDTGWSDPSRKGDFVIMRGTPMSGLKVTALTSTTSVHIEGVTAVPLPTEPRAPAAPKPVVPVASEANAGDVSDVSTPDDIDYAALRDDEGNITL